jgi:hypothetical protein
LIDVIEGALAYALNRDWVNAMDILKQSIDSLREELDALNRDWRDLEGTELSASQCYHFETDPPHFLYNLNCPDGLRQKLEALLHKHFPANENSITQ